MGLARKLFGPSREEIWRQLSSDIGARYVEGSFAKSDKVQATHGEWTVTLDKQDIEIGNEAFDRAFIIKGTDESRVRALLSNTRVQELIAAQPEIQLTVKDDEGWFGPHFPGGVDELVFTVVGTIKDVERLKAVYDLFGETLDQLCKLGSAYEGDPRVSL